VMVTGLGVGVLMVRTVVARAEQVASFHASFVTDAVLAPALRGLPLNRPLPGRALRSVDAIVRNRIVGDGRDVRVKIWDRDGRVLYSDYTPLIGRSFPEERSELAEVFEGQTESGISDLAERENIGERTIAAKLFQTYVPLRLRPGGPIVAVAEVYQDYAVIQGDIDRLVRTLSVVFAGGLAILFALLLPITLRASRALREQNKRLREQGDQLRVLLAREQQTVAELRDLDQRKSDFVAAASHELRTPLTAIMGYVRTLRRPEMANDAAVREEFLAHIDQQTERLFRSIKALLSAARLEEPGPAALELSLVDVRAVILEAAEELHLDGRSRIDAPPDLAPVRTDRERLRDVLIELMDNAVKYSPNEAPIETSVRLEGDRAVLTVRDHGVGIDPQTSEHIFDRFYQGDQSATRAYGGLGLGLHIVRGLVDELEGTVSVESEPGAGSAFTVELPVRR
jgi:signal transduction histidine kinase